jgi:hypothetical protein
MRRAAVVAVAMVLLACLVVMGAVLFPTCAGKAGDRALASAQTHWRVASQALSRHGVETRPSSVTSTVCEGSTYVVLEVGPLPSGSSEVRLRTALRSSGWTDYTEYGEEALQAEEGSGLDGIVRFADSGGRTILRFLVAAEQWPSGL